MGQQPETSFVGSSMLGTGKKDPSGTAPPNAVDEMSGLQKLAGLGGTAAAGYGVYKNIFGETPYSDLQDSINRRNRAALMGRLGFSPEELEQQRDAYGQQAAAIAGIGGQAAEQTALQQGMGGVPGGALSEKAVQAQTEYIDKAGDVAAKGSQQVGTDNLNRIMAEQAALDDDRKYLASLRSQTESTKNQLALMGGKVLLGIATGGASELVPMGMGAVNKAGKIA